MARVAATISPRQRAAFWAAHRIACVNLGIDTPDGREAYRKRVMMEEAGCEHLAQLGSTGDFDRVMARFAKDAGEWEMAGRFAAANEARKAALVRICCAQVMQLKGCPAGSTDGAEYLAGIVNQAGVACGRSLVDSGFWMDVNPERLMTLFQILDMYRRRLLRRMLDGRTARCLLGFDPTARYEPLPSGGVRVHYSSQAYADLSASISISVRRSA